MRNAQRSFRARITRALLAMAVTAPLVGCEKEAAPLPEVARPIKMLKIQSGGSGLTREYPGQIKAGQYSEMSFEVPGKVTEFIYKEGAEVKGGAALARLDPRDYQARYDSALAKENLARSERDRYKAMYEKDVKPYSEYEMRIRRLEVNAAQTREARKALDDTVLRSPFNGVMARKLVEEFENVAANHPVLVMQNDMLLEIKVSVPERDLAEGQTRRRPEAELNALLKPRVVVSSLPDRMFPARLKELANVADPTTRTFEATFIFPKPADANILGGMTAKVIIDMPAERAVQGALIPSIAVTAGEGGSGSVWVIDEKSLTASSRQVTLGELTGSDIEVTGGLEPGEIIAVSGVHQLRDGMMVRRYER